MLDKQKFLILLTGLGEMFDKQITEFMIDIYYDILKSFDYQAVEQAMKQVLMSHKYNTLPKPADILEFLQGSKDDKALIAWLKVKEALDRADYYHSVKFDDPIISHCLEAFGGWMDFCNETILKKDIPFVEKRFLDLYRLFLKREVNKPVKLTGFIEAKNREGGYLQHIPKPIEIGQIKERLRLSKQPATAR